MNLQTLSLIELKALAYDQATLREQCGVNINLIQQEIQKREEVKVKGYEPPILDGK